VNYFELHIVDYQRKTAHLTLAEHGAYSLMLQTFYATERPLPADRKVLHRLLRADSSMERQAIDSIVAQFWIQTDEGLTNKRAQEVLQKYNRWVSQQKANGSKGGRPKETHGLSNGLTQNEPNGGYRAFPHSDSDSESTQDPTPTPPKGGADRHRRISPDRAEKDRALEVWNQLVASGGALPQRDSRLQAAIDAVGGWTRIQLRDAGTDAQHVQRAFVEAYRQVQS
jgi:uncharacterized protein YdaU (DUF1376 family)